VVQYTDVLMVGDVSEIPLGMKEKHILGTQANSGIFEFLFFHDGRSIMESTSK
jgi:hypothetical protein